MSEEAAAGEDCFIPLTDYVEPTVPAEEVFRKLLGRVQALLVRHKAKPFIADDQLQKATLDTLDEVVAPPACGPLLAELDRTIADWLAESPRASMLKLLVTPPCDEEELVRSWAERGGHQVLAAPARDLLIEAPPIALPELAGEGVLVVPRLEDWFLRHRNGLRTIRALLAALDACGRPVVVGCNGWAWAFLSKAVAADLILPDPVTFVAFDEMRLHRWFSELAGSSGTRSIRFRRPETGANVLGVGEDGRPADKFLRSLAGRSLGIPWVAWHIWRRSLRAGHDESTADDAVAMMSADPDETPGEQTLWVAALDEFILPGKHEQAALLVLHALLMHGPLSTEHLRLVLPLVGESNIVSVLVKSGFVERHGEQFVCRPAAYPAIRAGLASAGLPLDR